ncbi:MAG: hypothetical protein OEY94_09745 [Alphaproteobacteria bacterium]|nr:hypothetical protein [Alphaproteobacteria bacterium]
MEDSEGFNPVLDDMTSSMNVDVVVKPDGRLWFFHDRPIEGDVSWIEYDQSDQTMTFVNEAGQIQDLGVRATTIMQPYLLKSEMAYMVFVENGKVKAVNEVVITVK